MRNNIIKVIISITMVFIILLSLMLVKCNNTSHMSAEQARANVFSQAQIDMGEDCMIVFEKYNSQNDMSWIGCINAENTHAIMYTASYNENSNMWIVNIFSTREGSNAQSLFSASHSMG